MRTRPNPIWITRLPPERIAAYRSAVRQNAPLAGLTFAIKDNLDLAGTPTTAGAPARAGKVAEASARAVERLIDAGAIPVGKTAMDQFATGLVGTRSPYGACHSVADPRYISGGSSSGSAVAVASGAVDLALGTDTAGSGRVPAAFNGIVGVKPTRGLVSARGLLPACPSLDCVSVFTRNVGLGRRVLDVLAAYDPDDPWSRPAPAVRPAGVGEHLRVVAVPAGPIDLGDEHRRAWNSALEHARRLGLLLVEADIEPFLEAARLLYQGPWTAERWAAFGHELGDDVPDIDPTVRRVVRAGRDVTGEQTFRGLHRLAELRAATAPLWQRADTLLLPVTPDHPTLDDVAADPVGVNSRLGTYTNFVNLLDLCAVSVPGPPRADHLPFGVQLIAPGFADQPLLRLAARWTGEAGRPAWTGPAGTVLVAVVGAHLTGQPLNAQLVAAGATLYARARTGSGYRLYRLPGDGVPRPALVPADEGGAGIEAEVWAVPSHALGAIADTVPAPLGLGRVVLDDGADVLGFTLAGPLPHDAIDITAHGSWRAAVDGR